MHAFLFLMHTVRTIDFLFQIRQGIYVDMSQKMAFTTQTNIAIELSFFYYTHMSPRVCMKSR